MVSTFGTFSNYFTGLFVKLDSAACLLPLIFLLSLRFFSLADFSPDSEFISYFCSFSAVLLWFLLEL